MNLVEEDAKEDAEKIRKAMPHFARFDDDTIHCLWGVFSDDWYCANYMDVPEDPQSHIFKNFKTWLTGEMTEQEKFS